MNYPAGATGLLRPLYHEGADLLEILQNEIVQCRLCPRLREYTARIAEVKRRAYRDWDYWGKPVPSFGDPAARVLILGLAPGAHGSNRTGRMFTGPLRRRPLPRAPQSGLRIATFQRLA